MRVALAVVTMVLLGLGVVMVYSASAVMAHEERGDSLYYLKRHVLFALLGLTAAYGVLLVDYRRLQPLARLGVLLAAVALIVVLIPGLGRQVGGARRWFRLGEFSVQPAELAKLAVIIYLADLLARKGKAVTSFRHGFLPGLLIVAVVVALVLAQPDLGTAFLIAAVSLVLFIGAGVPWRQMGAVMLPAVPAFLALLVAMPYRRRRLMAFADPWRDPQGTSFQIVQSMLAIGSGGAWGVGLGQSHQKLFYLPHAHTDFVFAVITEELGLVGGLAVLGLFAAFVWLGMRIAALADDAFGRLLSIGLVAMIGLEAAINLGVVTALLPTKGLPLPFVSYGGSSLVMKMVAVALLLNVAKGWRTIPAHRVAT